MASVHPDETHLPHLETFALAAETCNFTATAKTFNLTQAAVSQRIQILERTLGKSLFRREGGKVLLTDAGRRLHEFARQILDLHREARQSLTGQNEPETGELLLAASSVPGEHLLPNLLSLFRKKHPRIHVRATVSDSMAVMSQVEHGRVNLGLVGRTADNPHLEFRDFTSDRIVLTVPTSHELGKRKKVSLKQLRGRPLILREQGSGLRHCFEKAVEKAGMSLSDFRVSLELGSNEAIKEAVRRDLGLAVLSYFAVEKEIRTGELIALNVTDLLDDRKILIVLDKRRVLPFAARLFLAFLAGNPLPPPHKLS